jgi:hypothetical protein
MVLGHLKGEEENILSRDNILVNHFPMKSRKGNTFTNYPLISAVTIGRRKPNNNLVLHRWGTVCTYIQPLYARHLKIRIQ